MAGRSLFHTEFEIKENVALRAYARDTGDAMANFRPETAIPARIAALEFKLAGIETKLQENDLDPESLALTLLEAISLGMDLISPCRRSMRTLDWRDIIRYKRLLFVVSRHFTHLDLSSVTNITDAKDNAKAYLSIRRHQKNVAKFILRTNSPHDN